MADNKMMPGGADEAARLKEEKRRFKEDQKNQKKKQAQQKKEAKKRAKEIAAKAIRSPHNPASLKPENADVWIDRKYILAAMGLLSNVYPKAALRIMKKELEYHGNSEQTYF